MESKRSYSIHKSAAGLLYTEMLAEEGILVKTTIESQSKINELNKLIEEKKPLPDDVLYYQDPDGKRQFVQISNAAEDMTTDEIQLYISLRQAKNIRSIKGWVTFFGAIAVIGLILAFLSLFIH
ncbi:MAG: hypothetical protein ACI4WS_06890 [Oscillospiraceae bacterium]